MLKVGICDIQIAPLERMLFAIGKECSVKLDIDVFTSEEELLQSMYENNEKIDLLFLGILHADKQGSQIAKIIREELMDENMQIVYISESQNCCAELFDARPLNCLVKPINKDKVKKCVEQTIRYFGKCGKFFIYQRSHVKYYLPVLDILYIESNNRQITIHMNNGEKKEYYGRLRDAYEQVKNFYFIQIQQSYIVNAREITSYGKKQVTLQDRIELPISGNLLDGLRETMRQIEQEN